MSVISIKNFTFSPQDLLGKGSTGSVYKGLDTHNGRIVAIKVIDMATINNEVTKYLLQNETQALRITDHPNVIKAYDIIHSQDKCYIVMEFCHLSLAEHIKGARMVPQEQAMEIFRQIVQGYRELRDHRIVHRDLKPSNILLTPELVPKISDMGYCEIEGYLPKPKMFYNVGSPSYMAPEAKIKNTYNEKTDIWALGAILYEMLNGQTFHKGKEVLEAVKLIGKNGLQFHRPISILNQNVIKACLELNLAARVSLVQLQDLLGLERSIIKNNTSFYKEEIPLQMEPLRVVQRLHSDSSKPIYAPELQTNPSPQMFRSLIPTHQPILQGSVAERRTMIPQTSHVGHVPLASVVNRPPVRIFCSGQQSPVLTSSIKHSLGEHVQPVQLLQSVHSVQPLQRGPVIQAPNGRKILDDKRRFSSLDIQSRPLHTSPQRVYQTRKVAPLNISNRKPNPLPHQLNPVSSPRRTSFVRRL